MTVLDDASSPQDLNLPGYRLHPLKGELKGFWSVTVRMKNPAHPGRIVKSACLEPLGLSVTEGAKVLDVTRQTLTKIVNARSGISPEMAIRLSKAFGSTPETWLRMQVAYDLAQARKDEDKIKVRRQRVPQELHPH